MEPRTRGKKMVRGKEEMQHDELQDINQDLFLTGISSKRREKGKNKMENLPTQKGIIANKEAYNRYELLKSRVVMVEKKFPAFYPTFLESFLNAINDLGW